MQTKPNGGSACPHKGRYELLGNGDVRDRGEPEHTGMTLRDHFAGHAMISVARPDFTGPSAEVRNDLAAFARQAYAIADAMIAERDR